MRKKSGHQSAKCARCGEIMNNFSRFFFHSFTLFARCVSIRRDCALRQRARRRQCLASGQPVSRIRAAVVAEVLAATVHFGSSTIISLAWRAHNCILSRCGALRDAIALLRRPLQPLPNVAAAADLNRQWRRGERPPLRLGGWAAAGRPMDSRY